MTEQFQDIDNADAARPASVAQVTDLATEVLRLNGLEQFKVSRQVMTKVLGYQYFASYDVGNAQVSLGIKAPYQFPEVVVGLAEHFYDPQNDLEAGTLLIDSAFTLRCNGSAGGVRYHCAAIDVEYKRDNGLKVYSLFDEGPFIKDAENLGSTFRGRAKQIKQLNKLWGKQMLTAHRCAELTRLVSAFDPQNARAFEEVE